MLKSDIGASYKIAWLVSLGTVEFFSWVAVLFYISTSIV